MFGIERANCTHPELGDTEWHLFVEHFSIMPWDVLPKDGRGFEVGCGTGLWTALLSQRFAHVYGLDHRADQIAAAEGHCVGLPVSFIRSDFDALEGIDDASCQFGVALETLHHAPSVPRAFAAAAQKLVEGAPFLIYLRWQPEGLRARLRAEAQDALQRAKGGESPDPRYTRAEVRGLFTDAGFERVRFVEDGSFWTAVGFKRSS